MNKASLISKSSFLLLMLGAPAMPTLAEVYRCGGSGGVAPEYINNPKDAQTRGCKAMQGGNVTVVQGTAAQKSTVRVAAVSSSSSPRTDGSGSAEQKARDSDSRGILEAELRKAEARLAEQQKEYNNGEPEKQGIEGRNYQRYLDRVADLKDGISRNQSDIAGLKRELSRLPNSN
jgi:hypothetical protein